MGIEDTYRKKIEGFIRGVRMGTKQTDDDRIHTLLNGLKKINVGLAEDYLDEYIKVVNQQRKLVS
jgi:hypothetical protein